MYFVIKFFISISAVNGVNAAQPLTPQQPILTAQHIVTTVIPLGPHSTHTICPSCGCEVNTRTRSSPGLIAYVSGFLIAVFGCWLGCCLVRHESLYSPHDFKFVSRRFRSHVALTNAWTSITPVQRVDPTWAAIAAKSTRTFERCHA